MYLGLEFMNEDDFFNMYISLFFFLDLIWYFYEWLNQTPERTYYGILFVFPILLLLISIISSVP